MKRIVILGASGNLGCQCIDIIKDKTLEFDLVGFSVYSNTSKIEEILSIFKNVKYISVKSKEEISDIIKKYPNITFFEKEEGLSKLAAINNVLVINLLVGFVGFLPTLNAIKSNNDVALANKESLVVGGGIIMPLAKEKGVKIIPIDSEHSAIYQCLEKENKIKKILLTASGGPFFDKTYYELSLVSKEQALNHPNWHMGKKVSIDSASMFNKAFEVIEASYLFDVKESQIEVLVHRQSIIHSLVQFEDNGIKGFLSYPNMKLPISYAINDKIRIPNVCEDIDLSKINSLTFEKVSKTFNLPLDLARLSIKKGKTYGTILNASDEEAVNLFLKGLIKFTDIYKIVSKCLVDLYDDNLALNVENIIKVDLKCREYVRSRYHELISI